MMKFIRYILILIISISLGTFTVAQENVAPGVGMKKLGQSSMNFLQVSVSPRASAMGEAYTAIGKGAESIFYNPAGLPEMESRFELYATTTQWVADINYMAGVAAWNMGNAGVIGVSFLTVDYGDDNIWTGLAESPSDEKGYVEYGTINNIGAYAMGISYGRSITNKFTLGGNLRFVGQQLGESYLETGLEKNDETQISYDMGVKFYPGYESFRFGMFIRNFGPSIQYEEITSQLPQVFSIAVAMDMLDVFMPSITETNNLLVSTEFVHPINYTERTKVGVEYNYNNILALRGGYKFNTDVEGFSGGIGVTTPSIAGNTIEVGYSYSVLDIFDGINRFSLKVVF
ncbi:MAG: PorV/PorQ family protein [Candidatus Marinimicrobia bacterium]|nr:PorV/PorQ family protein [Candidatus Neomarinimicrobiota bacterium]MCF7830286.1 PorV/PorQ family protein [Candidatus Neomarinimicrobiota bacterium]MCF7882195.1 PorV/PorQ family protein [Candidatus Neomarinimicrobiota bacterium]